MTFKVEYQTRISLQDYNQQETGYFYLKKEETEDLRKYYKFDRTNLSNTNTNNLWVGKMKMVAILIHKQHI